MLGLGHFLAMLCILLPFSMMVFLIEREKEIRMLAGAMVIAMGIYLLINRRHPRILARVHPARLVLWSFLAAMAHGAGLMLVPIYLELCQSGGTQHAVVSEGHAAAQALMDSSVMTAFIVALVHTVAMTAAGALLAVVIYRWLGLKFISRTWFNLDIFWAISLIVVGLFGVSSIAPEILLRCECDTAFNCLIDGSGGDHRVSIRDARIRVDHVAAPTFSRAYHHDKEHVGAGLACQARQQGHGQGRCAKERGKHAAVAVRFLIRQDPDCVTFAQTRYRFANATGIDPAVCRLSSRDKVSSRVLRHNQAISVELRPDAIRQRRASAARSSSGIAGNASVRLTSVNLRARKRSAQVSQPPVAPTVRLSPSGRVASAAMVYCANAAFIR